MAFWWGFSEESHSGRNFLAGIGGAMGMSSLLRKRRPATPHNRVLNCIGRVSLAEPQTATGPQETFLEIFTEKGVKNRIHCRIQISETCTEQEDKYLEVAEG